MNIPLVNDKETAEEFFWKLLLFSSFLTAIRNHAKSEREKDILILQSKSCSKLLSRMISTISTRDARRKEFTSIFTSTTTTTTTNFSFNT